MSESKAVKPKTKRPVKFILGTIVAECPYKGQQFILQGKAMIEENGFESTKVSRCCNGRLKEHKGCVFEYVPETEAQNHERGLNAEVITYLKTLAYNLAPVIEGKNEETGEIIRMSTTSDMKARGFVPAKVRAIIDKDKAYQGWKFTRLVAA